MTLFAWAHALTPTQVVADAARFPGLGLVLNASNYAAAPSLTKPPIAFVGNVAQAEAVVATGPWKAAIILDERNQTGPSGAYMTPAEYWSAYQPIAEVLQDAGIPTHTMGLAPVGNWWQRATWSMRFDDQYHQALPPSDGRAFNPNKVRASEVNRVLSRHEGPWVLSPAPFRGWFDRLLEPVSVKQWAAIAGRVDVTAVALWCLREWQWPNGTWQSEHGLLDRAGNTTIVGREVLSALEQ